MIRSIIASKKIVWICLLLCSFPRPADSSPSSPPFRHIYNAAAHHKHPPRSFKSIPRGGATSSSNGNNRNQIEPFQKVIEPVGKALVDLTTSIVSLFQVLFSHQIEDPQSHIAEPIQRRINEGMMKSRPVYSVEQSSTSAKEEDKSQGSIASSEVFFPSRVFKLTLCAWVLSEALDFIGILNDDTPQLLKSQVDRVWYDIQPRVVLLLNKFQEWWGDTVTIENLEKVPPKYSFAIGSSLGMIMAPLLGVAAGSIWQPFLVVVVLAEVDANMRAKGRWSISRLFGQQRNWIGGAVEAFLERLRRFVRSVLPQPQPIDGALITTLGGSGNPNQKSFFRSQIVNSKIKVKSQDLILHRLDATQHSFVAMLRHGFLVGSAIGFFARV